MSTDRILVHSSIAPAFIDALKAALNFNLDSSSPPPTLVNIASKKRVERLVWNALENGAQLLSGSVDEKTAQAGGGVRMPPILLGDVTENMAVWQEEAFASLAACMVVDSDEEAIRLANNSGYGLSAAVFTEDLRKGLAMARKIQSGYVSFCA